MQENLFSMESEFTARCESTPAEELSAPLAARLRPRSFEEYYGQQHLLAPGKLLRRAIDSDRFSSIILFGPPGTGKTQTILNIIANAVMRGESVAVVSSNNAATANVFEKLKKYGVDFIAAPLGNSSNKEAFVESQNPNLPDMSKWKEAISDLLTMSKDEEELDQMLRLQNELSAITAELDALEKEYAHFGDYYATLNLQEDMPKFSRKLSAASLLRRFFHIKR